MKKLERKWAKYVLAMLAVGVVCALLSWLIRPDFQFDDGFYVYEDNFVQFLDEILGIAALCAFVEVPLQMRAHLRCPSCGRGYAMPWWKQGETHYCSHCGEPLVYDDEPEEAPKK